MATAAELIAQAEAATTLEELEAIEAQAEGRSTVLQAVSEALERLQQTAPAEAAAAEGEAVREPDFVWVGCSTCWQPQDPTRPVRAYAEWLTDGMRYRAFYCATCSTNQQRHVESHPTLYGIFVDDWRMWREGQPAAEPTEVKRWGSQVVFDPIAQGWQALTSLISN